ncbi:Putative peptidoglycan binding domain-containing protein [Abditibacterium utsteinense]|uniref:Peptidoglycan binding domain-containing protein n=1 Tax=Abditibacterium utsteinense TaxID=1960156 RepID=A0A2S8SXH5_9BACT|nr:VanW family protein [Abditibacterium utsteinense]PQV65494.1 Putative peptidoglycan binding domain-containing protein [Abditibacterium utsteinense]
MQDNVAFPSPQPTSPTETVASPTAPPFSKARTLRWPLWLGGVFALGACGVFAASGAYSSWASSSRIAPGVSIAGVAVGGLTQSEARAQLQKRFGELPLILKTGARGFEATLSDLGGQPSINATVKKAAKIGRDGNAIGNFVRVYGAKAAGERLSLPIEWNKSQLIAKLKAFDQSYTTRAVDARLKVDENGVQILPDQSGRKLNLGATAQQIQSKYFVGVHEIKAFTRETPPQISAADLAGEDVLLASYPTRFNPGLTGRTANIRVACEAIEGKVLMPGETFSFNEMTGERTFRKGYRMAHIFETKPGETEAEVVDGLAGGVCQVSSTLFNAVRRANEAVGVRRLKIVERNTHSLPVTYVPAGLDATVAWPYKDFRFRNKFSHPIYLRTTIRRSKLIIGIWGRVPNGAAPNANLTALNAE